jgi:hypothetical protein
MSHVTLVTLALLKSDHPIVRAMLPPLFGYGAITNRERGFALIGLPTTGLPAEAGGISSWIAAATSYSTSNRIMIPFYVY